MGGFWDTLLTLHYNLWIAPSWSLDIMRYAYTTK